MMLTVTSCLVRSMPAVRWMGHGACVRRTLVSIFAVCAFTSPVVDASGPSVRAGVRTLDHGLDPMSALPEGFRLARVIESASLAGQRAEITEVKVPVAPDLASAQLAAAWRADPGARVMEHRHGIWRVVSQLSAGNLAVLQLQADGPHARGFLTVWRSARSEKQADLAPWLPAGFRVGQPVSHTEGTRRITGFVVAVDLPAARALDQLHQHWINLGLQATFLAPVSDPHLTERPSILRAHGRQRELTALLTTGAQTSNFVITISEPRP